eukprot:m.224128 g.224128  ORF g.224128 m.224128 type:complete len:56 (+) comp15146_c0_seq7:1943-2110(+)
MKESKERILAQQNNDTEMLERTAAINTHAQNNTTPQNLLSMITAKYQCVELCWAK